MNSHITHYDTLGSGILTHGRFNFDYLLKAICKDVVCVIMCLVCTENVECGKILFQIITN
jgi:hypothetical protein